MNIVTNNPLSSRQIFTVLNLAKAMGILVCLDGFPNSQVIEGNPASFVNEFLDYPHLTLDKSGIGGGKSLPYYDYNEVDFEVFLAKMVEFATDQLASFQFESGNLIANGKVKDKTIYIAGTSYNIEDVRKLVQKYDEVAKSFGVD